MAKKRVLKTDSAEIIRHSHFLMDEIIGKSKQAYLRVGYLDDPDNTVYSKGDEAKQTVAHPSGKRRDRLSVKHVAWIMENGWHPSNIAPRPFLGPALKKNSKELIKLFNKELSRESKKSTFNINRVLGVVGRKAVEYVKIEIDTGTFAPLKDPTRKGTFPSGDAPILRDTYELYNSVGYQKVVE